MIKNRAEKQSVEMTVVGERCIYLNDYRIAGKRPHPDGNLPELSFRINVQDIIFAMPMLQLKPPPQETES